jgi:hypothetical protein
MAESKELVFEHTRMNMFRIKYAGGGQLPAELEGEFNNKAQAKVKIDAYLARKPESNGKSSRNKRVQHVRKGVDNGGESSNIS